MQKIAAHSGLLAANLALVDGAFTAYLRTLRRAPRTIGHIRWAVRHAAWWLACRHRSLVSLRPEELSAFLHDSAARCWGSYTHEHYRVGMHWWFHFRHPIRDPGYRLRRPHDLIAYPWQSWVDDFIQFLVQHRGLAQRTLIGYRDVVRSFLIWHFGMRRADWQSVVVRDIWRYARCFGRGRKPATLNHDLRYLRRFFVFLEMRGACSPQLAHAVPRFWNFGQASTLDTLNDRQRRTLLACFRRRTAEGLRDFCLATCMVDLGLRPIEVASLTLQSIDWSRHVLSVPPTKTDRGRQLPLVERIATALKTYVDRNRPQTDSTRLFVHHGEHHAGDGMDSRAIRRVISLAYRRCGFPAEWNGSYRLRHTFATRLHARGADLKQIADLLGHRHLQTTTIYTKVDLNGLSALALPWPI
jgi:integrase/recombinase XerD